MATYKTPEIIYGPLEHDIMHSTHALIAGATGSGKSVLLRRCLLYAANKDFKTILIDPKGTELRPWKDCVNTWGYAEYPDEIKSLLLWCVDLMEERLHSLPDMVREYTGPTVWVMIDEYADLVLTAGREMQRLVQRLAQKGRAAGIHVLLCTQRPTRDVIDGAIKVNITTRCALHVATAQDSRNIINENGAELLPAHGYAYLLHDLGNIELYETKMLPPEEEKHVRDYMVDCNPRLHNADPCPVKSEPKKSFFKRLFG